LNCIFSEVFGCRLLTIVHTVYIHEPRKSDEYKRIATARSEKRPTRA